MKRILRNLERARREGKLGPEARALVLKIDADVRAIAVQISGRGEEMKKRIQRYFLKRSIRATRSGIGVRSIKDRKAL
jgi:hypothetical protein